MSQNPTPFKLRCRILSDTWVNFKEEDGFQEFFSINDLGVPLAYAVDDGLVMTNPRLEELINETWNDLMSQLEIEDTGFTSFNHLFDLPESE